VRAEEFGIGGIVVGHNDRVLFYLHVALQRLEQVLCQMVRIPSAHRRAESRPQLMDGGLRNQGHRHLAIANIEIHRSRTAPAQRLIEVEEFLNVPSLVILVGQGLHLIAIARGQERFEVPVVGPFATALDILMER